MKQPIYVYCIYKIHFVVHIYLTVWCFIDCMFAVCVRCVHRNSRDTNSNLPYHRFSKIPFDVRKFNFKNLRQIENEIKPRCCMSKCVCAFLYKTFSFIPFDSLIPPSCHTVPRSSVRCIPLTAYSSLSWPWSSLFAAFFASYLAITICDGCGEGGGKPNE